MSTSWIGFWPDKVSWLLHAVAKKKLFQNWTFKVVLPYWIVVYLFIYCFWSGGSSLLFIYLFFVGYPGWNNSILAWFMHVFTGVAVRFAKVVIIELGLTSFLPAPIVFFFFNVVGWSCTNWSFISSSTRSSISISPCPLGVVVIRNCWLFFDYWRMWVWRVQFRLIVAEWD